MISRLFAPLGMKIFGGLSLALLVAVGIMTWRLSSANETIEKRDLQIAAIKSDRDRYKDALAFFVNDGRLRVERGQSALKDHEGVSADLRRQAEKIRTRVVTVKGDCRTPAEVMGASGL